MYSYLVPYITRYGTVLKYLKLLPQLSAVFSVVRYLESRKRQKRKGLGFPEDLGRGNKRKYF